MKQWNGKLTGSRYAGRWSMSLVQSGDERLGCPRLGTPSSLLGRSRRGTESFPENRWAITLPCSPSPSFSESPACISGPALVVQGILNSLQRCNTRFEVRETAGGLRGWCNMRNCHWNCLNLYPQKILPMIRPGFESGFDSLLVLGWFFSGIKVFIILTCVKQRIREQGSLRH